VRTSIINRIGLAAIAGCVAVGSLALAGCGGGDDTTTAGTTGASGVAGSEPLSKEEFVSQANAICADANEQIEALVAPAENTQVTEIVPFLEQAAAIARESSTKLEALTPPSELEDQVDTLDADSQKGLTLSEDLIAAAKAGDSAQVQAVTQQLQTIDKKDDKITSSIGLTECAKDVDPQG
jgi:hypothetical protein